MEQHEANRMQLVSYQSGGQGFDEEKQKEIDRIVDFSWRMYNMYNTIDGLEPLSKINANTYKKMWIEYCNATNVLTNSVKEYIQSRGRVILKKLVDVHHNDKFVTPAKRIEIELCEFSASPLSDSEFQSRIANVVRQLETECTQNEYNERLLLNLVVSVSYQKFSVVVIYQTLQDAGLVFDALTSEYNLRRQSFNEWYVMIVSTAIEYQCKHHGFVLTEDTSSDVNTAKLKNEDFYCFACGHPVLCLKTYHFHYYD